MAIRLFVGNLPYNATEAELREHFSSVGPLSYVYIPVDRETGKPRGFAFVEFAEQAQADEAVRRFNNQPFKGRPMAVNEARAKEDRPAGGPPRAPYQSRPSSMPSFNAPDMVNSLGPNEKPTRNFGPDAAPRRKGKQAGRGFKSERGPKGPIRERSGGQIFGEEDESDLQDEAFEGDNFASSASDWDAEDDE